MLLDGLVGVFGAVFLIAIVARILIVRRKTGNLPIVVRGDDSAHDFLLKVFASIFVAEGASVLAYGLELWKPDLGVYASLGPFSSMHWNVPRSMGLTIAFAGLAWMAVAQAQMGEDWRIGDNDGRTRLVRHGLFGRRRHPIYLGFMVTVWGMFLALPNVISLLCAVLVFVVLSVLARLEEEFQLARHGITYRDYLASTRRWI